MDIIPKSPANQVYEYDVDGVKSDEVESLM